MLVLPETLFGSVELYIFISEHLIRPNQTLQIQEVFKETTTRLRRRKQQKTINWSSIQREFILAR